MNRIGALIRRDKGNMVSLHHMRTQQEGGRLQTIKGVHISQHLGLGLPSL